MSGQRRQYGGLESAGIVVSGQRRQCAMSDVSNTEVRARKVVRFV